MKISISCSLSLTFDLFIDSIINLLLYHFSFTSIYPYHILSITPVSIHA